MMFFRNSQLPRLFRKQKSDNESIVYIPRFDALIVMVWQLKSGLDKVLWAMCTPWIMKLQERLPKQWL